MTNKTLSVERLLLPKYLVKHLQVYKFSRVVEQAISLGVQGIIVSHGQPEALKDVVRKALDAGIKVVAKDMISAIPRCRRSRKAITTLLDQYSIKR